MERYSAKDAREKFADVIGKAAYGTERIVITRNGKDTAAVVPISDLELLAEIERFLDTDNALQAITEAEAKGNISLKRLKDELGL